MHLNIKKHCLCKERQRLRVRRGDAAGLNMPVQLNLWGSCKGSITAWKRRNNYECESPCALQTAVMWLLQSLERFLIFMKCCTIWDFCALKRQKICCYLSIKMVDRVNRAVEKVTKGFKKALDVLEFTRDNPFILTWKHLEQIINEEVFH